MIFDLNNEEEVSECFKYFCNLKEIKSKVELKKLHKKRTLTLNSYMHVCISLFAIEFGYTLEEAKTLLKRNCSFMIYEKKGIKFLKKTSKLDNKDCSDFVEFIRNYASTQGLYIPTSEEYKQNNFKIDKEISKHKEYL